MPVACRYLLVICICGLTLSKRVRVTELRVPSTAVFGESVALLCSYELGSEELYVVKWYKDDLEFYRYEPKDDNQSVYFPQPGVNIDLSKSGSNSVYLRNVALDTSGSYKCQVSTDAPSYSCVQAVKEMNVIVLPEDGPTISGGKEIYDFGENITLNCTSAKSKPAAQLYWIVNDQVVDDKVTVDHGVTAYADNLEKSSKTLSLPITDSLLSARKVSIKCKASFYDRISMNSKDITVLQLDSAAVCVFSRMTLLLALLINLWPGFR
ncbi:endothelial cell-selective adhesion molecule-like [Uloborus diversus]|uniref:endothelial cell-selective adhesion molecule-like n=1 Tax=Uloborus diversus TaxID=327109 RepID=UPI00240A1CA6|nr:endothelial cell-selective adhesion molecule-like [Uloborus diversus]